MFLQHQIGEEENSGIVPWVDMLCRDLHGGTTEEVLKVATEADHTALGWPQGT